MHSNQDLIDIAEEAIRNGEKVCNGANVHDMRTAIALVGTWITIIKKNMNKELLENGIDQIQELKNSIQRLREETLKAFKRNT